MTTWIERTARRKSVAGIVLFVAVTVTIALLYVANGDFWREWLHPARIGAAELKVRSAKANSIDRMDSAVVTVSGESLGDAGVQEVTTYEGILSQVTAGYSVLRVGDRLLIVKSSRPIHSTVTGILDVMPYDLTTKLFPDGSDPALKASVYPLLLDTDTHDPVAMSILWTVLIEGAFGFFAWRGWRRLSGKVDHPSVKRARGWGELSTTSSQLEHECQNAIKLRSKGWVLTDHYLVRNTILQLDVFRLEDLVWAYPEIVQRKLAYVIPVSKRHLAVMYFREGVARVDGKQPVVKQVLEIVSACAPWAVIGYSAEMDRLWKAHKEDVIAEVMGKKN